jgi:very-short-patch-repair endonuclease
MSKYAQREGNIACSACIRSKTVKTLETRYGVINTLDIPKVREKLSNPKTEQLIEILLQNAYKVKFVREYILGPYSFDFFVPESNLLIECQGDFFHGFKQYGYSGLPKDRAKASWVETHTGYKLVWIWEHELNLGRVKKVLDFHIGGCCEPPIDVKLVKLHFKKIQNSEAHAFLTQFHYLGNLGTIASCYGAYLEETLVAVCAFGGVTRAQSILKVNNAVGASYGPKQLKELRRFCIRPNARTKNMGSYCLRRFLHAYAQDFKDVLAILSFSDTTVDDAGTIYKASNWKQLPSTSLSYHYLDINSGKRIHKRTVWDSARQNHMTESEFVRQAGLEKIIEEPKTVWLAVL